MANKSDVARAFGRLVAAIGGRVATGYNDVGAYQLDYNPTYGGANVELIDNESGGVSQPFGSRRYKPQQFVDMVRFTCDAIAQREGTAR